MFRYTQEQFLEEGDSTESDGKRSEVLPITHLIIISAQRRRVAALFRLCTRIDFWRNVH